MHESKFIPKLTDQSRAIVISGELRLFMEILLLKIPYLLNYKDLYKILVFLSKIKMYRNMLEQSLEDFQI
jgi:hypothetical protein